MPENESECVVEESFLTENDIQIGDTITLDVEMQTNDDGEEIEYLKQNEVTIVGTVQSPLYISSDRGTTSLGSGEVNYYIYVPKENINASSTYTVIYIKVAGADEYTTSSDEYEDYIEEVEDSIEAIKEERENARHDELVKIAEEKAEEISKLLGGITIETEEIETPTWYILDRNSNAGYVSFIQDTESIANISKLFPAIFFIVAVLISLTSMTRMVEEQRMQIGTLKALGYSKHQISLKYTIYAGVACIVGSILGMCVGFVLLPKIIWAMYSTLYEISDISISFNLKYGGWGLILISICILGATIYTILKELKNEPAVLMRPKAPKSGNRVMLEKIPFIWKRLNFSKKVTVRNLFRYKKRFYMTIIGILGCTALILTGFGIKDSVTQIIPSQYEKIFLYNLQVTVNDDLSEEQTAEFIEYLNEKDEIAQIEKVYMTSGTVESEEDSEDVQIIVAEELSNLEGIIDLYDVNTGEALEIGDNEIGLTDKAADLLGVEVGDTITLTDSDNIEREVKITYVVENYVRHYIFINQNTYESIYEEDYNYNVILIKDSGIDDEELEDLATELMSRDEVSGVTNVTSTAENIQETLEILNYVVVVLIVSAGLLAFVVLYNLENVNISERVRELATIKVLGFYDKEVYNYVTKETIILTIIGIILGLVFGTFLSMYIITTCEINMLRFPKIVHTASYIYSALITIVFSVIVNIATYFALKKIDMIESLKSVE